MNSRKPVVLIVEDNRHILELNRILLTREGLEVHTAADLKRAREVLAEIVPDLVLLDIMLPDGDGMQFIPEIRAAGRSLIMMLTSKRDYGDILGGLTGGADDYLTKPYRNEELKARVAALLLRRTAPKGERYVRCGPLTLDTVAVQAFCDGKSLRLTPKEFALLHLLVQKEGESLSAGQLYEAVWNQSSNGDVRAVKAHLSNLRRKIEGCHCAITSSRGGGYRFVVNPVKGAQGKDF